jgi:SAM-dependent methyltransferase
MDNNLNLAQFRFEELDSQERTIIGYKTVRTAFLQTVEQILDSKEYQFAARLKEAAGAGKKLRVMDIGCSEGLFLHELAAILEARRLLGAVELNGLDDNPVAIETAESYALVSTPPRPYLHFYLHDATLPFEECLELRHEAKLDYDLLLVLAVLELLPDAKTHLARFYNSLKPGGIIYLRLTVTRYGEDGTILPHPLLEPFGQTIMRALGQVNPGVEVAFQVEDWLRELGASQIKVNELKIPIGGTSEVGRQCFRLFLYLIKNTASLMIRSGQMTQTKYDQIMQTVYQELTPEAHGQIINFQVLAKKS